MNYAYTLGILEVRVAHRADRLQQVLDQMEHRIRSVDYDTLRDEIMALRADIEYAKTRGECYD